MVNKVDFSSQAPMNFASKVGKVSGNNCAPFVKRTKIYLIFYQSNESVIKYPPPKSNYSFLGMSKLQALVKNEWTFSESLNHFLFLVSKARKCCAKEKEI